MSELQQSWPAEIHPDWSSSRGPDTWMCNHCHIVYYGKFAQDQPDSDCLKCGYHDSVCEVA